VRAPRPRGDRHGRDLAGRPAHLRRPSGPADRPALRTDTTRPGRHLPSRVSHLPIPEPVQCSIDPVGGGSMLHWSGYAAGASTV